MRLALWIICATWCTACTELPDVKDSVSSETSATPYPALIALGPVATQTDDLDENALETEEALRLRAAGLRARAANLRAPVLNDQERARLTPAVN